MSFSKLKKNIQVNQSPQKPNPFQLMEHLQDHIAQLSYQLADLIIKKIEIRKANEHGIYNEDQAEIEGVIEMFKQRLNQKTNTLQSIVAQVIASKPPIKEDKNDDSSQDNQSPTEV